MEQASGPRVSILNDAGERIGTAAFQLISTTADFGPWSPGVLSNFDFDPFLLRQTRRVSLHMACGASYYCQVLGVIDSRPRGDPLELRAYVLYRSSRVG